MQPIPDDWIERLFGLMEEFYGVRWTRQFKTSHSVSLFKTIWKSGLHGLNYDQIKGALYHYRRESKKISSLPPIVTEFYQYASDVLPSA